MSVLARVAQFWNIGRARPVDPARGMSAFPWHWVPTGLRLSNQEETSVSVVWACIQAISTAIASSPWNVFEVTERKRVLRPEDPLAFILNQRASEDITAIALRESLLFSALATGNGYAEIQRDFSGRVVGIVPLLSERMLPKRTSEGKLVYVYSDDDGNQVAFLPAEIYHLRGPVSVQGLMGDSVVGRATKAIALAAAAERFSLSYLANGTITSGVLKFPTKIDDRTLARIRDQWAEKMGGPKSGGKPVILEGGATFESIQADPDKAQLVPTQQWATENIARYFGVPLVKLGIQAAATGYGTNVSQLNLEWTRSGLTPWARRLEQEANAKLLSPRPYRETTIDMNWLVRGDAKEQADADKVRIESGVFSVNEIREKLGENTLGPEGDLRFVPNTLQPLTTTLLDIQELAAKEPEPAPVPGAESTDGTDTGADSEDDAADEEDDSAEMMNAARQVIAGCLDRYGSRLRARKRQLQAQAPDAADALLADERAKSLPEAVAEVRAAMRLAGKTVDTADIRLAFDSVEAGALGRQAADHLWGLT